MPVAYVQWWLHKQGWDPTRWPRGCHGNCDSHQAALLIAFAPVLESTSASTLLFSNKNMNKQSSLACSGNEAAQAFNHQWHLWIVGSTLGLCCPKTMQCFWSFTPGTNTTEQTLPLLRQTLHTWSQGTALSWPKLRIMMCSCLPQAFEQLHFSQGNLANLA